MSFGKPPNPLIPGNETVEILEQKMRNGANIKQRCGCRMSLGRDRAMFRCPEHQAIYDSEREEEERTRGT